MAKLKVIGTSIPRVDALDKVTGQAKYATDFRLPHMLHGKLVRSPYPHARILRIDISKAQKLSGVKVIATSDNTPPISVGMMLNDRHAFPIDGKVRYTGDVVAAIAAETEDIAEEAAGLVQVEYDELPAVFNSEEAFKKNPTVVIHPDLPKYQFGFDNWRLVPERPNVCYHFKIRHGDVKKGFQESDLIEENRYSLPRASHCRLEPLVCLAWIEPDGTLTLEASAKGVWVARDAICKAFELPPSKVRVHCRYIGGDFGGRGGNLIEIYASLLTLKAGGRPVRVCHTREDDFHSSRTRPPSISYIKDGIKNDGTLIARESTILLDMGAYAELGALIAKACAFAQVGIYRIPNFKLDSYAVYTNTPMSGPFRGFGSIESNWPIENQMDIIAEKLGLDSIEIRRKNLLNEGERDVCGQIAYNIGVKECLDKVVQSISLDKEPPVKESRWKRGKGISLACKHTIGHTSSGALVKVHSDGAIEVRHSSHEVGMGVDTVVAQVAAEEFGLGVDDVKVVSGDTALVPYGSPPMSQRETFHMGNAVQMACQDAKRQLLEIAAARIGIPFEQLEIRNKKVCVVGNPENNISLLDLFNPSGLGYVLVKGEIIGIGLFSGPSISENPETGQGERMVVSYSYGAYAVEVGVDVETGETRVLKSVGCFDMGQPINPKMCEGQIEGSLVMGIGAVLYEEMVVQEGVVVNPNFHDYKIPTSKDVPDNENTIVMLTWNPHREGPFGAKGIGEQGVAAFPPAVSNALHNAVGIRINDLVISREKLLNAIRRG